MPHYELITESGTSMVANYENDEEMMGAVSAHHAKAKKGEMGGPSGHPAERIVRVEKYSDHPASTSEGMSADVAKKEFAALVDKLAEDGVVSMDQLAMEARLIGSPLVHEREDKQSSMYVAEAEQVFTEGWDDAA